jgi:hypothetical protein
VAVLTLVVEVVALTQEALLEQVALVAVVTAQILLMALLDQLIQVAAVVVAVIHQVQDHLMAVMAVAV